MKGTLATVSGLLFALGLTISGMTNPNKVIAFLDLAGAWNPALALVMGGAVVSYALLTRVISRRAGPMFDDRFHLPTRRDLDRPLLIGSAMFGVGWGLGGFCPGPALTSLGTGGQSAILFVIAMTVGMLARQLHARIADAHVSTPSDAS